MDDLDTAGMLARIDAEIAKAELETRERIARAPDDKVYAERQWITFSRSVARLRQEREVLVTAMARVKSFEPARIIVQSNP